MSELSKYESLLNELSSLETQASVLRNKYKDEFKRNSELEKELVLLKKENAELNLRIAKLEDPFEKDNRDSENNLFNSLNLKERETLKLKLQSLLNKIEFHLSSDR